jgi:hypothetical protein
LDPSAGPCFSTWLLNRRFDEIAAPGEFDRLGSFYMEPEIDIVSWSRTVAALALDALADQGLLKRED